MATYRSDCTRDAVHYAAQGGNAWKSSSKFYSGKDGTYYRSRVSFTTGSFVGKEYKNQRFIVSLTIDSTSSPCGCWGVLHTKGDFVTNDIMNSGCTGPNSTITANCVGQSCAYTTSAATTESKGTNKSSGYTFYFSFPSDSLQPNTHYYLYCCYKSGRGSSTGWTRGNASAISAWVEYTPRWELKFNKHEGVASATGGIYDDEVVASSTATASDGYLLDYFEGTLYDGSGTSTWYDCNGLTTYTGTWTMQANREIDVYAYRMSYTLTYHLNDEDDNIWEQEYTPGMGESLLVDTPERDGYLFLGWYESISDSMYFPGDPIPENWGNRLLSAQWELATYTVHFNTQNDLYMEPITVSHGESIFLDYPEFHQYMSYANVATTFDGQGGYTPNPEVTMVTYSQSVLYLVDDDGVRYEVSETCVLYKDTTLTLVWREPTIYEADSISLPVSEKTGHTFLGWFTSATGGAEVSSPYYPTSDDTLYARWEANVYNVFFVGIGGEHIATFPTTFGDPIFIPEYFMNPVWWDGGEIHIIFYGRYSTYDTPVAAVDEFVCDNSLYIEELDEWRNFDDLYLNSDHDITIRASWTATGRERVTVTAPDDSADGLILSYWECGDSTYSPLKITPTSVFEWEYNYYEENLPNEFYGVYEPFNIVEFYVKEGGQYKTGKYYVKSGGQYIETNRCLLTQNGILVTPSETNWE